MKKKFFVLFSTVFISLLFLGMWVSAEGYIFTSKEIFHVPYSSSIKVVNADHGVYTADSLEEIEYLINAGIIDTYEEEGYCTLFDYELSDPYYDNQKAYLSRIFTQFAWNRNVFGKDVKIAIIDSGLYEAASDFNTKNIIRAYDYTSTSENSGVYYCMDENGHGSMVAGIIAAGHNTRGIAGIAPNSSLYIFKCFDKDRRTKNSYLIDAVYRAVDEYDVDIINMSFGGTNSTVFKEAIDYAESKGVLLVAAAGNDGNLSSNVYYPASYDNVISVGSLGEDGHRASHSQRNDYVNVLAPGEKIYSVTIGGYESGNGTSFATPIVSASAALALSLNPNLTNKDLQSMIYQTADEMEDRYSGFGSLNIQALLTYVKATDSEDLIYSSNGSTVYFSYIPPQGYRGYFTTYNDKMLSSVFTVDEGVFIKGDTKYLNSFKLLVWDKNTLSPYKNTITKTEY
ncbi:MAG: S8 family peptidase [Clostridia bacterium]